ncbi:cation-translocating P-type ATPase [Cupriavidus neocaledonicus]|uniref:Putative calcium P-type ATPase n=1 Tax=Cupriavidus neocaledonicus TaxID=1040979 RepID=A0A375HT50_9BURK|nr:HAD-IC family P-type ATPase [Cupriavidus neocaledonicus]SPD59930.1 putative calcium P-type ATPase [Cupriavidus neocaledonicus]
MHQDETPLAGRHTNCAGHGNPGLNGPEHQTEGLTAAQAFARLAALGPNALPQSRSRPIAAVFLHQFRSPLIYILLVATVISVVMGDIQDATFIGAVLLLNGIIGTVQEHTADKAATALRNLEQPVATVIRDGEQRQIDAGELVPGDLVLLEAGGRVPADLVLIEAIDLQCDESLLTGESLPVRKACPSRATGGPPSGAADESPCLAFAGTVVMRGRGRGIVEATGAATQMGRIASELARRTVLKPPLVVRLELFSRLIGLAVGVAVALLALIGWWRDMAWRELFMMSVGLAVSAIPEGLPVAISVALAIGMRRMARAGVIVRKMPAVESLGSCTMIATDKTGTLTMNELVVTEIRLPDGMVLSCDVGHDLDKCAIRVDGETAEASNPRVAALLRAAALPNEAKLIRDGDRWAGSGDSVDVALLAAAYKGGAVADELRQRFPLIGRVPYEPDLRYAASFHEHEAGVRVFVKGAPETLIGMCDQVNAQGEPGPMRREPLLQQARTMAAQGLRVLAFAEGMIDAEPDASYGHRHLVKLTFLGLAGMKDPVRPEVPDAIRKCYLAGIDVAMVTGDDPVTAAAIGAQAGMRFAPDQVLTGDQIRQAGASGPQGSPERLDALTRHGRIYARVTPDQKLAIILSLARSGHFVAVTGDGINDAPALKHAHVGVAMGRKGTEVAKESADIVITDDNFASIVAGIHEGRVAYANIRKVVYMLVSTGAAEVVLFLLAIPLGLPMPLLPAQLLWLNVITNGIQDVALAAERAEGNELSSPPRKPDEPIFDRVMIRRVCYAMLFMGLGGFLAFYAWLQAGYPVDAARNLLLLFFVLAENVQTANSRSEHRSVFRLGFFANPLLVTSVMVALGVHVGAMYLPGLSDTLRIAPVTGVAWLGLLGLASTLLVAMELDKWLERKRRAATPMPGDTGSAPPLRCEPGRTGTAAGKRLERQRARGAASVGPSGPEWNPGCPAFERTRLRTDPRASVQTSARCRLTQSSPRTALTVNPHRRASASMAALCRKVEPTSAPVPLERA